MNFFARIWNIVVGKSQAALNKLETPEDQLRLFVSQLDSEMTKLRQSVTMAVAEEKKMKMRIENQLTQAAEWEKKAMFALSQNQEDLAREALLRKSDLEEQAMLLKTEWQKQTEVTAHLQNSLRAAGQKAEKAKRDYVVLVARLNAAKTTQSMNRQLNSSGANSSASLMEGLNDKIMQIEADSEAELQILGTHGGLDIEAKFVDLDKQMKGDMALQHLKAKMQAQPQLLVGQEKKKVSNS